MPKKSRLKRFGAWLMTLFRSVGAVFYPPNVRAAFKSVTKNWKEYICFYIAALVMTTGFWTLALCTESNLRVAEDRVAEEFDYHVEVALLDNEQYANLDGQLAYQIARENEFLESYYWVNGGAPLLDGTYSVRIVLDDSLFGLAYAYDEVHYDILNRVSQGNREIRFSPLYTFRADYSTPYNVQFWSLALVWFAFSVLMLVLLFLIRLDHFKFLYGIYMTCGADFAKLMGAAGGELLTVTVLTWPVALLVGGGIAAALYLPLGVMPVFTVRAVLTVLLGGGLAAFVSAWFPMRLMASRPPVRLLAAADNTSLVSSPRRSFFLFGESFPGKYELYGFWRMRKYYLRLVLSAVLFAAFFVSGLYIAELESHHNQLDTYEYLVAYRPAGYFEVEENQLDEDGNLVPPWTPTAEEAEMVNGDVELFLEEMEDIPGVSHAEWEVRMPGGYTLSHLLLTPGQIHGNSNYVASDERASEGYKWAANDYEYTAIDKTWIDSMLRNGLCTFEGDPYALLTGENMVIIGEEIYNKKMYDFAPGDQILVAVCEESVPLRGFFDPKELLRAQVKYFEFRYETYTVCAVAHGLDSGNNILFGITYDDFAPLTGIPAARTDLKVYMENGTDMDTVSAAEVAIRESISYFKDWRVTPTGNFFEAQVKSVKNDDAVILTLAVCLLLVSPMIWYFSQIMFYRKRRNEFAILHALGAPDGSFARLHRLAGGVLSGLAFLCTVLLTLLCNYLVYTFVNTLLPKFFMTESVHYEFALSWPALVLCVVVSVLCGFLSCELPYRLFTKPDVGTRRVD